MMKATFQSEKYIKFIIYAVVIVLVNLAASTLLFRIDLTENKLYSLSDASKAAVAKLSDPLTINVFFTENLPAPHNGTQQYLRDMLEEYALYSNKNFNYRFYDVSPQEEGGAASDKTKENQKLAENYGIAPVEIRMVEKDELKFKKAYMGMVMIQGDIIERIPAITSTDGLEYKLTTLIEKLNKKISTLAGLPEKVHVKLFMSSSIGALAPVIGIKDIASLPESVKQTVEKLNAVNFGQLTFEYIDPATDAAIDDLIKQYNIRVLQWPDIPEQGIQAGRGAIGMGLEYKNEKTYLQVMNVMRIPIIGTRYELINTSSMEETINETVETLIGINEDIGYLADHGTLELANPMMGMQPQGEESLQNFQNLVNENYNLKPIMLKEGRIPESLGCLIIAKPTEEFSDYELYQIDQAVMRGTHLAIFSDGLKEIQQQQQQFQFNMGPTYQPLATGLEKLLDHYGVKIKPAYILDKNCFKQQMPPQAGGGERPIYFAPMIKNEFINHDLDFMKNIKGLIALNASPVLVDNDTLKKNGLTAQSLVASSDESWEMSGQINLNPMMIQPPQTGSAFKSISLASLVEGSFTSYFKGKEIPRQEEKAPEEAVTEEDIPNKADKDKKPDTEAAKIESKDSFIAAGKPGKISIVGSSALLKDNLLDAEGNSPNAAFILNLIDTLNGRDDIAAMRSKIQQFNPLEETSGNTKTLIKGFNVAGLPVIIVLFGLLTWWRRSMRRKNIRLMFQK
ncbi:MAG: ABC transporter permease [Desulfobacteraceae bacterium]|nr:MAG: ABC transporter permease [Desulfobacteraceae bacterium]